MIHRLLWTGWGLLIALIGFGCLLLMQFIVDEATMDKQYYLTNGWPKLVAMWLAAAISLPVGRRLNGPRQITRTVDKETGLIRVEHEHTLLFIPVQYWWIIFLVLGGALYFA